LARAYVDAERKAGIIKVAIISNMELIIGCRNKAEVQKTEEFIIDERALEIILV
jgi:hypothetical protein